MKTFNIYKKRDGQSFKKFGEYFCASFEDAKREFALNCWNDLLEGKHGDNYVHLAADSDGVKEDGIYYLNGQPTNELDCFFPVTNLDTGISSFTEDVYTWEIRDNFKVEIFYNNELDSTDFVESLEEAEMLYPSKDGFTVKKTK